MSATILATGVAPIGKEHLAEMDGIEIREPPLAEIPDKELARVRALCVSVHDEVGASVLDAAPDLELVVTRSTGIDNVDVEACRERGVDAFHLPEYATEAVAELTVAGMTLALRRVPEGTARTREGRWDRSGLMSRRLPDATVGVVGVGRIGREVARRCTDLGADVLGYDIAPQPTFRPPGFAWMAALDQVLPHADVLTLHVPLDETTRHMIGAEELGKLPEGAVVVNTSRGPVVETAALLDALDEGTLGGAVVDVLEGEPDPPLLDELAAHPRTIVTPHVAAFDERTVRDRYRLAVGVIREHL